MKHAVEWRVMLNKAPKLNESSQDAEFVDDYIELDHYSYMGMGGTLDRIDIVDFFSSIGLEIPSLPLNDYSLIAPIVEAYYKSWCNIGSNEYAWLETKMIFVVLFDSLESNAAQLLIDSIDLERIEDLNKIYLLEEIIRVFQVHYPKKIDEVKRLILQKDREASVTDNYFMRTLLKRIISDHVYTPGFVKLDEDKESVFEISKGLYAIVDFETASLIISGNKDNNNYFAQDPGNLKYSASMVVHDEDTQHISDMYPEIEARLIFDYIKLIQHNSRDSIESEFHFLLTDLTIKEQIYFLSYLKNITVKQAQLMQSFTSLYGVDGMRTFLSLERGDETLGDAIVAFGQHDEIAGSVFKLYGSLLDAAEDVEKLLEEALDCEKQDCQSAKESVRKTILDRAHKVLTQSVQSGDISDLETQLQKMSREGVLLSSISRNLYEDGNFSFDTMRDFTFTEVPGNSLPQTDIVEMERLYRQSYAEESFQGEFIEGLLSSMQESIADDDTRWYVLRHQETPIGFCKITDRFDDSRKLIEKHFGAFNVNPKFGGGKLGEAMFTEVIDAESMDNVPIIAECLPSVPISSKYIETGFNAVGTSEFAGHHILHIIRTPHTANDNIKNITVADLLSKYTDGNVRLVAKDDTFQELQQGQVIKRLFRNEGLLYALFQDGESDIQKQAA